MPDHWDTKPETSSARRVSSPIRPRAATTTTPTEIKLKDDRGRLRLPAYILIAMVIATVALLLVATGLLLAPR